MKINKKTYLLIAVSLIAILLFLLFLINSSKIQTPSTPGTNIAIPTISAEPLTNPSQIPTSLIPTDIVPGVDVGEDGLPYQDTVPTDKLINKVIDKLNPIDVSATSPQDVNPDNFISLVRELIRILFSFNPSIGGPGPNSTPYPSPPNPNVTFTPGVYGPPPDKPYYSPTTGGCYSLSRLIQFYANNITSATTCWDRTKQAVDSSLTAVNIFGLIRPVHVKAAPYFTAVDNQLAPYKISGSRYRFAQGEYEFVTPDTWTYNFRCNRNASGSQDLCSPQCILSPHAFGIAIDVNPATNANGSPTFDMPPEVVYAFENNGFRWGGRYADIFGARIDAMHFEYLDEVCR